jgi:hypothetical protein
MNLNSAPAAPSGFLAWFSNPWVGIAGTIASIVGVLLAIYFYSAGEKKRELIVSNDPPFSIVKAGETGSIDVIYKGKPITTDVYVCRLYIWNAGAETIHRDNILEPIQIELLPNAPILDATIRKVSRPVAGVVLDTSQMDKGILSVSWKLLEHNDGAVVDVIYASDREGRVQVSGVIEQQPQVRTRAYNISTQEYDRRKPIIAFWATLVMALIILVLLTRDISRALKSQIVTMRTAWIPLTVYIVLFSFALLILGTEIFRADTTPPVF